MYLTEDLKRKNKEKVAKLRKEVGNIFDFEEIEQLATISDSYKNVFKSNSDDAKKLYRLADSLMMSSSYLERLNHIRNDLIKVRDKVNKLINKSQRIFYNDRKFLSLPKKNQLSVIDSEIGELNDLYNSINSKLEIVDTNIKYLTDIQFNIKSCINILKQNQG